jgi:DnaJ-class molecular chaperone
MIKKSFYKEKDGKLLVCVFKSRNVGASTLNKSLVLEKIECPECSGSEDLWRNGEQTRSCNFCTDSGFMTMNNYKDYLFYNRFSYLTKGLEIKKY